MKSYGVNLRNKNSSIGVIVYGVDNIYGRKIDPL